MREKTVHLIHAREISRNLSGKIRGNLLDKQLDNSVNILRKHEKTHFSRVRKFPRWRICFWRHLVFISFYLKKNAFFCFELTYFNLAPLSILLFCVPRSLKLWAMITPHSFLALLLVNILYCFASYGFTSKLLSNKLTAFLLGLTLRCCNVIILLK